MKTAALQIFYAFLCFLLLNAAPASSEPQPDYSTVKDTIELFVRWTDKKVVINGVLDEPAWDDAEPYEAHFFQHQPLDRAPSSEKTRVMVLQDAQTIYFGILCYDSEPERIFASSMRRDRNYGNGEVIELLLDTFRDNRNCYAFDTNPLGGKGDALIRDQGNHINKQWECVIYMDGRVNDQGWAAEFAIPFKSLKYHQGDVVDWGINITREIKHRQEETYLVPVPRSLGHMAKFRGENFAVLRGVRPPKQGFDLEVSPYLLLGQTRVYGAGAERKNELNRGVDFKYDLTTQLALDMTYKTDFAQAEAEEEIVNVTRFNIQRQEKRRFFLQNAGYFQFGPGGRNQSNFSLFDSRTIGILDRQRLPLLGGGKLTGRAGDYSIAALGLQSERVELEDGTFQPSTSYFALRLKRDISKNSHIGLMALSQGAASSGYSRTFGLDALWNVTEAVRLDGSAAQSVNPQSSMAGDLGFVLNKEWIDVNLRYTHIDSLFNPRMGFVRRSNIRHTDGSIVFTKYFNGRHIQNIAFSSGMVYVTDHHSVTQTRDNVFTVSTLTSAGDEVELGAVRSFEFVPMQSVIRDIVIDAGVYDTWSGSAGLDLYRARPVTASMKLQWGKLFDGDRRALDLEGTAKISNHLSLDLAYAYNHLDLGHGELTSHVLSTRWIYSFTPDLFAKAYLQWNSADQRFAINLLFEYAYRPRSHIYLVYNEDQDTVWNRPRDRIIMLKMTYLWQI